jgi:hypothetical protein
MSSFQRAHLMFVCKCCCLCCDVAGLPFVPLFGPYTVSDCVEQGALLDIQLATCHGARAVALVSQKLDISAD